MTNMSILRRLIEAGTPDELVDEVAGLLAEVRALDVARAKNAERQARWKANNVTNVIDVTSVTYDVSPSALDKETSPKPPKEINLTTRGGNALPRKAAGFSAPEGVSHETWIAFCQQRKKPLSRIAFDRITKTLAEGLEAGWPPGEIAERAVERGYETFFLPNEKRNGQPHRRTANDDGLGRTARAALSAFPDATGGIAAGHS